VAPERAASDRRWLAALWLVLLVGNAPLVLGTQHARSDADSFFCAVQMLIGEFARAGELLVWNPWSNAGEPSFADPQAGALSPVCVAFGLVFGASELGFRAFWLFSWGMGAVGTFLLGRRLGAPAWGAFGVAVGFACSGFYTGHAQHTSWIHAYSLLPLAIARLDVALLERRRWPALEAGVLWGLTGLYGYPGLTVLGGGFAALWAAGRWLAGRGAVRPGGAALAVALVAATGCVVLAPTYLGFLVGARGYTHRTGELERAYVLESNALPPRALASFASPYLPVLELAEPDVWPGVGFSNAALFTGCALSALAAVALLVRPRDRWRLWLAAVAALALGCSMSQTLPLRGWLYDLVPPTRYFRHSGLFRAYALFGLAVLALEGTRDLARASAADWPRVRRRARFACALVGVSGPLLFAAGVAKFADRGELFTWAAVHAIAGWLAPLGILVLARGRAGLGRRGAAAFAVVAALDGVATLALTRATVSHETGIWDRLAQEPERGLDLAAAGEPRRLRSRWTGARDNKSIAVGLPTLDTYTAAVNVFHMSLVSDDALAGKFVGGRRHWFSPVAAEVALNRWNLEALKRRTAELGAPPLVVHSPEAMLASSDDAGWAELVQADVGAILELPPAARVPAEVVRYEPRALELRVDLKQDGWLLVSDRWARGWRARVNGEPAPVWGAAFVFRGLRLEAGENRVEFAYDAFGLPWLLVASWSTAGLVLAGSAAQSWRRRRAASTRPRNSAR